jgi:hypothetical protein
MKIGVLIPSRGDRPEFLEFAKKQMSRQTLQPDFIEIVDDPPLSDKKDITYRYRIGCKRLFDKGADLVAFIEDDDWYSADYLKIMSDLWIAHGRPSIIGINETYYYHLAIRAWQFERHPNRASAMSTLVSRDVLNIAWNRDEDPWTDIHLWKVMKGPAIAPPKVIAIGIKHGVGLCGGMGHVKNQSTYKNSDKFMSWLQEHVDPEAAEFYTKIQAKLK